MDNKIDFIIPEEIVEAVTQHLKEITGALQPFLIALTPEERQAIPKINDKSIPFVEKTLDYTVSAPEFAPPYMNTEELKKDMKVFGLLTPLLRKVDQLKDGLEDTTMQAGAESYLNALTYYNSVKMAARIDVPNAKSISEDLGKRFVKTKKEDNGEEI